MKFAIVVIIWVVSGYHPTLFLGNCLYHLYIGDWSLSALHSPAFDKWNPWQFLENLPKVLLFTGGCTPSFYNGNMVLVFIISIRMKIEKQVPPVRLTSRYDQNTTYLIKIWVPIDRRLLDAGLCNWCTVQGQHSLPVIKLCVVIYWLKALQTLS